MWYNRCIKRKGELDMKYYQFFDEPTGEEFAVYAASLREATMVADEYFDCAEFIGTTSGFDVEMSGIDVY